MKKALFFLLLLVVALAITPLFLPKTLYVEEEYVFDENISTVYEYFYDMQKFTQFDQWSKKNPNVEITYSSPSSGPNASYVWTSNAGETQEGKVQIIDSKLDEFINYNLNFGETKGNVSEIIFQEMGDNKTRVIWTFESAEANYPFQVFNILMRNAVKEDLAQGFILLDNLLKKDKISSNPEPYSVKNMEEKKLFGVLQQTSLDQQEIDTAMAETFGFVRSYLIDANEVMRDSISNPVVLWKMYDVDDNTAIFICGYFIEDADIPEVDGMEYTLLPAGRVIKGVHQGSYLNLPNAYSEMRNYAAKKGFKLSKDAYDIHLNTPEDVMVDSKLRTEIYIPLLE
ncbi:hypothetical protein GO491_04025 [Flavobacteriaceae bacterium Ap0902]|nr:hypothetical protein [Flavobacteriaceae bacterium Ap0902]